MKKKRNLAVWIEEVIRDFCATSPDNRLGDGTGEKAWGEPLVGFSRGDDPFYRKFKEDIGPFHWTPLEAFDQSHAGLGVSSDQLAVITWILPQTGATKADQRREPAYPAERWVRSRHFGEAFNVRLRLHLVETLGREGIPAVAPERSPLFAYRMSERFGLASNWSERHAAFVAGLGTFGLSDGLITPVGKAMRCGSVVARAAIHPTPRPYEQHQAWCLFHAKGTCGICAERCPAEAITATGHDKQRCCDYIRKETAPRARMLLGADVTPCGLCQTGIPCESGIPPELRG